MNNKFQIRDKVKPSIKALERHVWDQKRTRERRGIVCGINCKEDALVRVKWDGNKIPETVHESFLEKT